MTSSPPQTNDQESARQSAWKQFGAFLHQRGERITQPRQIVFHAAVQRDDHFTADQLADTLACGRNRVSRGTVYRTLALLVAGGWVREIRDGDTHAHYESLLDRPDHEHLICRRCGTFVEFSDPQLNRRIDQAARRHDFAATGHRVTVFGLCRHCRPAR